MRRLHLALSLSVALLLCGIVATPALAAKNPAVADCVANARLTRSYTAAQLQNALATMPTDIKQYTDCYDVIQRALLQKLGKLHGSGGTSSTSSGGSFLPTPLLIVLIVLVVAAGAFGAVALRRRSDP
jgi:hypothetical protein